MLIDLEQLEPRLDQVEFIESRLIAAIQGSDNLADLEAIRVGSLGRRGVIRALLGQLKTLSPVDKVKSGSRVHSLRTKVQTELSEKIELLKSAEQTSALALEIEDVTLPLPEDPATSGRIHPISQVTEEMIVVFSALGFSVVSGPDIETENYNFTMLNFPEDHPAREDHDTFYFPRTSDPGGGKGPRYLLRTQTSTVQIRQMLAGEPPFRFVCPGRTYRCDSDQTHTPMFHQMEGLVIDRGSNLGHLKWTIQTFLRSFFEHEAPEMRFRSSFFPFTEPSLEVDIMLPGDRSKPSGWLEVMGCGMVHPNVLRACGHDPEKWQGYAFGMGIDRLAMLKYGISDLRHMFEADLQWLEHFGFSPLVVPSLHMGLAR